MINIQLKDNEPEWFDEIFVHKLICCHKNSIVNILHSLSLMLLSHISLHLHFSKVVSALGYVVNLLFSVLTRFDLRAVNLESLHSWHVYTSGTLFLRIFAHEKWIQVSHSEHSIIGRPAYGFIHDLIWVFWFEPVSVGHVCCLKASIISNILPQNTLSFQMSIFCSVVWVLSNHTGSLALKAGCWLVSPPVVKVTIFVIVPTFVIKSMSHFMTYDHPCCSKIKRHGKWGGEERSL